MVNNKNKFIEDFTKLIEFGNAIASELYLWAQNKANKNDQYLSTSLFWNKYQHWFSESHAFIAQILPYRLAEFDSLYYGDENRNAITYLTYTIKDWLVGIRSPKNSYGDKVFSDISYVYIRVKNQVDILESATKVFESSLFDIKQIVQADLFDSELDVARELLKNGFIRAAGAVAGVVLESHLKQVCENHQLSIKETSISHYNEALKNKLFIEVPDWRFIQGLGDLRNLCGHKKDREPKKDEVAELIDGVDKIIKKIS